MTIYFANDGIIDLDVIRVMGISIKTGKNPIGYFGTGLKFAISTLLRTGHQVVLTRDGEEIPFSVHQEKIRGADVHRIWMGDEKLPFTTDLGRNWEVWQAYRELHSNTLDEAGEIRDTPMSADTVFAVSGAGIEREFHNRHDIFVSGKPLEATEFIEVYPGPTRNVYYRGVRAGTLPEPLSHRYNLLTPMTLTEDRTFESQYSVEWKLSQLIPRLGNRGIIHTVLSNDGMWDQKLNFVMCPTPSKEFLEICAAMYTNMTRPEAARRLVDRDLQNRGEYPAARMNDSQHEALLSAFPHLLNLGCTLSPEDVEVVESLGPGVMGLYHGSRHQIFIAVSTFDWGLETVVATLYEEWLHKEHGYEDESRELQTFLFQKLVAMSMGEAEPDPACSRPTDGDDDELPF